MRPATGHGVLKVRLSDAVELQQPLAAALAAATDIDFDGENQRFEMLLPVLVGEPLAREMKLIRFLGVHWDEGQWEDPFAAGGGPACPEE